MKLEAARFPSPIGTLAIGTRDGVLSVLDLRGDLAAVATQLQSRFESRPDEDLSSAGHVLEAFRSYFAGEVHALDALVVDTGGTPFQRRVWGELRRIAAGTTVSYSELARRIGAPKAVRAVAAANGSNPVAIVIPCHRVIAADGRLWGYGGGLERKAWLLAHEGVALEGLRLRRDPPRQGRLFVPTP
jgi:methylated-DNA-[protein]-cysteine S-methyltransferase